MRQPTLWFVCLLSLGEIACGAPPLDDHTDLTWYRIETGEKQPIQTADEWAQRRRDIVRQMERVMGPLPDRSGWPAVQFRVIEKQVIEGGIERQKIQYVTHSVDRSVKAWLLLPAHSRHASPDGRRPAVLCLHQTTAIGKDEPAGLGGSSNLHYALELAQHGFVTLAPDYPSFGESADTFPSEDGYVSGTMKAVSQNMRAVDVLQVLPQVDAARIGVIGHSLGGHNAMFTAVFDIRLRAIVSSCGFTRFHKDSLPSEDGLGSWTAPSYMPRIATDFQNDPDRMPFDFPEVVAAIAPRPFLTCSALHDSDFDISGVRESLAAATPIYRLLGAEKNLRGEYPDSPHDFPPATRKQAYQFLTEALAVRPDR